MVILAALIAVSGVMMVGSGEISLSACSELGLEECFNVVYKYVGLVVGGVAGIRLAAFAERPASVDLQWKFGIISIVVVLVCWMMAFG